MIVQHAIEEALAHLGAALMQTVPSDDQIIMDHVKAAHAILTVIIRAQRNMPPADPDTEARITVLSDALAARPV